ncbi:phosphoribosylformylglycinamidine synthase [Treponema primitia ZAS-2]|uniref:Phosphoribosylformylglycinamidine synthase n=1 Tax=Treponema primitia (strain ATCC BAA-887 / DSM 12427 / ZAS-2) TaxID=545694 RepID=F5YHD1_TREPZ|nr:phosphoribosylformylglycinamidine synthase [Treponema primitia]AEF86460.1 phosphoribosylformylglycinamidine synthase [Treponema primitia ZAS-2]
MIRRVFVEKRAGFDGEARRLRAELADFLGAQYPELARLRDLRILQRYDVAGLEDGQFRGAVNLVFSEPQCDEVYYGELPAAGSGANTQVFGIEYLSGQFNQRADSAEQCVELAVGLRPVVRSARVFILEGERVISNEALEAVKRYLINPVDSREASMELPLTLEEKGAEPSDVPVLEGFSSANPRELDALAKGYGLAMSAGDLLFCRVYFSSIGRDPSLAELRVLDTYWSDHCRHTTFTTALEDIAIEEGGDPSSVLALKRALSLYEEARQEVYGEAAEKRKQTLMDLATIGTKVLNKRGLLTDLDESKEINACSIRVQAEFADGSYEPWLLLFKNETHNHPTEIEPFGGAATCLGGAIRDPLSGRAYVHQAMRVSGGGDPRRPLGDTLPGKLPQLKIAREAAAGYSSYGNQIGLTTGQVSEFYHPGFVAKRLELGAVIGAVPEAWVRREEPAPGDLVLLVGGKTGRDGIGGATGSSKAHTGESVESAGAEVQKGNAVEERKLQRLFRNSKVTALIKRCNDFGAGGVAVAVGELAAGLDINLDKVPKKYAGLDGMEIAISESQERMAVVVAAADAEKLIRYAAAENLDAVIIATVSASDEEDAAFSIEEADQGPRLRMSWRGKAVVDLSRRFLNSNGAPRSAKALMDLRGELCCTLQGSGVDVQGNEAAVLLKAVRVEEKDTAVLLKTLEQELGALRSGSRRGLQERFDGSIGAASALYPWGGAEQGTPECGMAALLPSLEKESRTVSLMSFGYDPDLAQRSPYEGAKSAIREALAKYACLGGNPWAARLSLQEYFERMDKPASWGKPLAALLGALEAELALGIPAIGGKDSMSGSYRDSVNGIDLAVPPTLVAFAAGTAPAAAVRSGALSGSPASVVILLYQAAEAGEWDVFRANMDALAALSDKGLVRAAYPVGSGGGAAALALMAFGNMTGLEVYEETLSLLQPAQRPGSVLVEIDGAALEGGANGAMVRAILAGTAATAPGGAAKAAPGVSGAKPCWAIAARTLAEPVFRVARCAADPAVQPGVRSGAAESAADLSAEAPLVKLRRIYEGVLAKVYPQTSTGVTAAEEPIAVAGSVPADGLEALVRSARTASAAAPGRKNAAGTAKPLVVLPVFPGTNCEWDMERAFRKAGARTRPIIFRNRNREDILESTQELAAAIAEAQIVALSGGFSAGDEPDGSGKFIANVFRSPAIAEELTKLLDARDGLVLGICNGFQALIKLGLVPYGEYREADPSMPTLSFNRIGRHVSRMVRTKVVANPSPWLALENPGTVHILPVSHGEGRIVIREEEGRALFAAGQVPFCYADPQGKPTMAEPDNPNGSDFAIEGLTSPDGRVLGKMAHSERCGEYVHINIPGNKRQRIFEAGVGYFG